MKDSGMGGTERNSGSSQHGAIDQRPIYGPASTAWEYQHSSTSVGASLSAQTSSSTDTESMDLTGERLLVRACYKSLSDLPFTQWGKWDISRPDHRLEAAKWFADHMDKVDTILRRDQV